jgi:hypothetical protein
MAKVIAKKDSKRKDYFPYEVCIPVKSKENPVQLRDTTLMICKAYRIPASKITIKLAEQSQEAEFRRILLPGTFGKLVVANSAYELFPVGTRCIFLSSCLTGIFQVDAENPACKKPAKSLLEILKLGFQECHTKQCNLWTTTKSTTLKSSISTSLKQISSNLYGCILTGIDSHLDPEEEIERSILYYQVDKCIVKLNMFSATSCKVKKIVQSDIQSLQLNYPEFITMVDTHHFRLLCPGNGFKPTLN